MKGIFNKKQQQLFRCFFSICDIYKQSCLYLYKPLNPKPISTPVFSPFSSTGYCSNRSFSVPFCCSRIRVCGKITSFSVSSICEKVLNLKPSSTQLYSSNLSTGYCSDQSFSVLVCRSRIRVRGKIRPFSVSPSDFENRVSIGSEVNNVDNVLNPKPASTHLYSSNLSTGYCSVRTFSASVSCYRIRVRGKIRSFSAFSSDFENRISIGSDEFLSKVNNIDYESRDNPKLVSEILDDDCSVANGSSKVIDDDDNVAKADSKLVFEIVEAIRNCKDEKLEIDIVLEGRQISTLLVNEIFRKLNSEKVSALPFVAWAQDQNRKLLYKADFQSLIIDNCGWLGDYDTMIQLLLGFSQRGVCLTEKAFGFLAGIGVDKDLAMSYIREVVDILNEVGGSCRGTGIVGLIKKLCELDLIEMAMYVIQISEKKSSYYNIIVHENCVRARFDEARDLLEEMRRSNCNPNALSYTYILSGLCKNGKTKEAFDLFEEMKKNGCEPDALSFEIIIFSLCKFGNLDVARQYFGEMVNKGLEPRISTNGALIKGYFNLGKYEEAHKFVLNLGILHKSCGNSAYSLLVSLHFGKGHVVTAGKLLIEMMNLNFVPNFTLCKNISKQLLRKEEKQMANDIKAEFSRLRNGIDLRLGLIKEGDSVVR